MAHEISTWLGGAFHHLVVEMNRLKGDVPWWIRSNPLKQSDSSTENGGTVIADQVMQEKRQDLTTAFERVSGTHNPQFKEGIMAEFTSGFFMGDSATNGRILVVDDEADIRKVVRMTLQKAGYEVLEAENGEKAIETINAGENRLLLDVVICDIRMPKINGVEAIAYFRSNYPRVPLIVLTGFPDTDMATSMLRQGVVDYLVKPVEGDKLREAVGRAMEQRELAHL